MTFARRLRSSGVCDGGAGAYDVPGDGIDEDCDGTPDDEPTGCDSTLTGVATTSGSDGAMAIDLCRTTTAAAPLPTRTWGVISATYVFSNGTPAPLVIDNDAAIGACDTNAATNYPLGLGILGPTFGTSNAAQSGRRMLGLSSGTARQPTDPGFNDYGSSEGNGLNKCYTNAFLSGFPAPAPACPGITFGEAHDGAALSVILRVPTNALTMSFDTNLFSHEFPGFVCTAYDDTYVVVMTPAPTGEPASASDNIVFDSSGNPLSVSSDLLSVCDTNTIAGTTTYPCSQGPSKLAGTGFAAADSPDMLDHASTDWLETTVSVASLAGQEITLLFAVWDSEDGYFDTTVLVDNVHWTFAVSPDTVAPPALPPTTIPKG